MFLIENLVTENNYEHRKLNLQREKSRKNEEKKIIYDALEIQLEF